ncbi:MAG: hypothetical protein GX237_05380 [Clostridiales bacterium]|nr:hypothetical protein [Clostridiales bacterium]
MQILYDIVQIGDKIEIKQLDKKGDPIKSAKTYVSQVLDLYEGNKISIASPIKKGILVLLEVGVKYRLVFYTMKGLYQCDCTMLQKYREKKMVISLVEVNTELEKIQRRQYYRLECIHEIEYRIITKEETELEEKLAIGLFSNSSEKSEIRKKLAKLNHDWLRASIIDLSGGGCRFTSEHEHNQGDKVVIKFDFYIKNELKRLNLVSDIIISRRIEERLGFYEHRAEFSSISDKDREDLIKYIFEQERKLRKNDRK